MKMLFVLIPLGLLLAAGAVAAFFWAVNNGQFDDLDAVSRWVPEEDHPPPPPPERPPSVPPATAR
jgi:cbb3-type cytochrome oxidase maturation protein